MSRNSQQAQTNQLSKELVKLRKRDSELDIIIKKLFEQNALGVVSDERFATMAVGYEAEQKEVRAKTTQLQNQLDEQEAANDNTMKFLDIVGKYADIQELDANILNDLIDSIVVYNAENGRTKYRTQRVDINYRFIGNVTESIIA